MQRHTRPYRFFLGLLLLGPLAGAALTTGPAQAASGVGPFFPEPAWDRKIAPVDRFLILTNWNSTAVLDKETGLVWERSPDPVQTGFAWSAARFVCADKTWIYRKSWRLPSVHELASLIHTGQNPALPLGHPFTTIQSADYWSASSDAEFPTNAWVVNFSDGTVFNADKATSRQVWCVRGGMNADAY